ncbi:MAG: hypothetical protein HZC14_01970 [Candidatus Niyogibacteria bacterium]|nr:hypothetical protein [Candidatus Niyogibacteria bacterium]
MPLNQGLKGFLGEGLDFRKIFDIVTFMEKLQEKIEALQNEIRHMADRL